MPTLTKKVAVAAAATAVLALTGGAAVAYWTTGGTGTGAGAAGTTQNLVVNQTTVVSSLHPGIAPVALAGTFTNPNPYPVQIAGVTAAVTAVTEAVGASGPNPCTTADFQTGGSFGLYTVPAGPGTAGAWSGLTVTMKDTATNQDRCKDATIEITYTIG